MIKLLSVNCDKGNTIDQEIEQLQKAKHWNTLLWENSKDGLMIPQESRINPSQHQGCESVGTFEKLLEEVTVVTSCLQRASCELLPQD